MNAVTSPITVLSVPAGHRYVEHIRDVDGADQVDTLPDAPVPGAPAGQWWPPPALDPALLPELVRGADVAHLHFGFEHRTPEQLREWVRVARDLELPWVLTVHDLTNPHLRDQRVHLAQLAALLPSAAAVITLTEGAATDIQRRWGRRATVIPHPHMAPLDDVGGHHRDPVAGRPLRVGVHLKSLRANTDARIAAALEQALLLQGWDRATASVRVLVHDEVRDPAFVRHDPQVIALLEAVGERGLVAVEWIERMDDAALTAHLADLDLSVLPYRWGTHSGWLEECHDLGTAVLAPDAGHYGDQGPALTYAVGPAGPDPHSLAMALRRVREVRPTMPTRRERVAQRQAVARAHREIYEQVVTAARARRAGAA